MFTFTPVKLEYLIIKKHKFLKMKLTETIKTSIDKSVLCWLATASTNGFPNVSPKELFTYFGDERLIIAHIASPQTMKNINQNPNVCISFVDVFVQKGFQLKGKANILTKKNEDYKAMEKVLFKMATAKFPFKQIIEVKVENAKHIVAPSYLLYPETKEEEQIESALKAYGVKKRTPF